MSTSELFPINPELYSLPSLPSAEIQTHSLPLSLVNGSSCIVPLLMICWLSLAASGTLKSSKSDFLSVALVLLADLF